ncbi:MAG: hypothetical protein ACRES7_12380 [Gammaproteobacteria bacterium]
MKVLYDVPKRCAAFVAPIHWSLGSIVASIAAGSFYMHVLGLSSNIATGLGDRDTQLSELAMAFAASLLSMAIALLLAAVALRNEHGKLRYLAVTLAITASLFHFVIV